jgi:hypothetical protein
MLLYTGVIYSITLVKTPTMLRSKHVRGKRVIIGMLFDIRIVRYHLKELARKRCFRYLPLVIFMRLGAQLMYGNKHRLLLAERRRSKRQSSHSYVDIQL